MAAASAFQIPILPEELILSVIKDVTNIPFTASDLKTPTYEKLYSIYSGFLCSFINISNEQVSQVPLHVLETIAHPELFIEDSAGNLMFFKAIEYMFNSCGVTNFSANDVLSPTRKRTRKLLSAIVNFAQFLNQHEKKKMDLLAKLEMLKNSQEIYTTKRDHLKERITSLKAKRVEKQRAVQEMNLSAIKARQQETSDVKGSMQRNNEIHRAEVDELQNLLTVTRASKLLRQGNEAVEEHLTRAHTLTVKEKSLNALGASVPSSLKLIQSANQDVEKFVQGSHDMEYILDRLNEQAKVLKDLTADIQNCNRSIKAKSDRKQRCLTTFEKKMEVYRQNESQLEKKKNAILRDVESKQKQWEEVNEELRELTEFEMMSEKEHKHIVQLLQDELVAVQKKLQKYQSDVTAQLGDVGYKLNELNLTEDNLNFLSEYGAE